MRSEQYVQGYRSAWRDAIEFLHSKAKTFRDPDPKAKAILNAAAFDMGVMKGYGRLEIDRPTPATDGGRFDIECGKS